MLTDSKRRRDPGPVSFCYCPLTSCSPVLYGFILKGGWLMVCSTTQFTPDSWTEQDGPCEHGSERSMRSGACLVGMWFHCPSRDQELLEESATCWVFTLTSGPSTHSHLAYQWWEWALVASSGVFLSSPEFLGTKNESYYWDNEPFNGLCVDLSAGVSEANPKL